jgi:hypothetical protein
MKTDTDIIALRESESVGDPLTGIALDEARWTLATALHAEATPSPRIMPKRSCRMPGSGLSSTGTVRDSPSRLGSSHST